MNLSTDSGYGQSNYKNTISNNKSAKYALYFGIASLFGWIIPFIGIPISMAALILGYLSLGLSRRDFARSGISLGIIGLLLSLTYMMVIYYLLASDFFKNIEQLF